MEVLKCPKHITFVYSILLYSIHLKSLIRFFFFVHFQERMKEKKNESFFMVFMLVHTDFFSQINS